MKKANLIKARLLVLTAGVLLSTPAWSQMVPAPRSGRQHQQTPGLAPEQIPDPVRRDPHAYSDGYTLQTGPYALSDSRQLHLADDLNFAGLSSDRFEWTDRDGADALLFDGFAWYGNSYDRLMLKGEGEVVDGEVHEASTELAWSHAVRPFWDIQLGVRHDSGEAPDRSWLAAGLQGLAPYWFEVDATAYLGSGGDTALSLEAEYNLRLTQRLILQPRLELSLYGHDDRERGIGSGLSSASAGLRLRYEFSRQFAPYLGYESSGKFGQTAEFLPTGAEDRESYWVAGIKFWF